MKQDITIREKYDPAMMITDREEAQKYFEKCVKHTMSFGKTREEAIEVEKINLGYYAGYYDMITRLRVEDLFDCTHPIFGNAKKGSPTLKEAFNAGVKLGKRVKTISFSKKRVDKRKKLIS